MFVSPVNTQPQQARSAKSFVNSLGVHMHLHYLDTPYGKYDEIIKPRLQELGIHHIRDSLALGDLNTRQKFKDLAKIGIKSTLIMDPRDNTPSSAVMVAKSIPESVEAVDGPNEWDISPQLQYKGQNFPEGVRKFQTELYSAIKSDSATAHLPVLSPSIAHPQNTSKLGSVTCDIASMHSYPGGKIPITGLDSLWIPNAKILCGANKPIMATECGYHNGTNIGGDDHPGVSEQAAAKYLLRLYFEYFNRGIERAFTNDLIDIKPSNFQQWNFGLLRYDGSPKSDFVALKNLISLLQDPEKPTSDLAAIKLLNYNLQGNTENIHHTLLQKSDRTFYFVLWQEVPSFDQKTKKDLVVPKRPLTLALNTSISQATIYEPVNSITPLEKYDNVKQLKLKVPDHPLVIELTPARK
jgi:hypothetical protein